MPFILACLHSVALPLEGVMTVYFERMLGCKCTWSLRLLDGIICELLPVAQFRGDEHKAQLSLYCGI